MRKYSKRERLEPCADAASARPTATASSRKDNCPGPSSRFGGDKAAQEGQSLEDYLGRVIQDWANGTNGVATAKSSEQKTAEERAAAWREWVASHRPGLVIADDSRESIYAGRGE